MSKPIRGRATGKTFRKLLYALMVASEGKSVVFLSCHQSESRRCYRLAEHITMGAAEARRDKNTIVFPNKGSVFFDAAPSGSSEVDKYRGLSVEFIEDY